MYSENVTSSDYANISGLQHGAPTAYIKVPACPNTYIVDILPCSHLEILGALRRMAECVTQSCLTCTAPRLTSVCRYETSAAIIETETSTVKLAQEVRNRAILARFAAKQAALIAEVKLLRLCCSDAWLML
jgi:hypothetical protein